MSRICTNCNTENIDEAEFCRKCGSKLSKNDDGNIKAENIEEIVGNPETDNELHTSNPYISTILSIIIPGLGLIYIGKLKLVLQSLFIYMLFLSLCSWSGLIHMKYGGAVVFLLSTIVYIFSIIYTFIIAKKPMKQTYDRPWISLVYTIGIVVYAYSFPIIAQEVLGFRAFRIPANSMSNSLVIGDHIIVNTWIYNNRTPSRGDIVAFESPQNTNQVFLKRCIAVPNDEIFIVDKDLYIHYSEGDEYIKENFKDYEIITFSEKLWVKTPYTKTYKGIHHDDKIIDNGRFPQEFFNFAPIKVQKNNYFMMGDNRDHSYDSRFFGAVPKDYLIGTVSSIYYSSYDYNIQFTRIGNSSFK